MIKLLQLALLIIMVHFTKAYDGEQACDIHKLSCPPNSICTPDSTDIRAMCICIPHWEINHGRTSDEDYCSPKIGSSFADTAAMKSNGLKEKETNEPKTVVHIQPPAESHHVILGILVPMLLVLVVIGAAYGVKKFHLVSRLREYVISRRRNRPLYEDVMMTQELDDPPLM